MGTTTTLAEDEPCPGPIFKYEDLQGKSETDRLLFMRTGYETALNDCTGTEPAQIDSKAGFESAIQNINNSLLDITDAIPTDRNKLFTTFYGPTTDKLDPRTRRSTPWGTVITEIDTYKDSIPVATSPDRKIFETKTVDDIKDPDFTGIDYVPSKVTPTTDSQGIDRDKVDFTTDHDDFSPAPEACLKDLVCTFDDLKDPTIVTKEVDIPDTSFDVDISDSDITSGCANGSGLFDKLMTAIDSSIDLQYKNSRLDAKTFGQFYAATISSAMQQTMSFLVQKEQLKLDAEKVALSYDIFNHDKDKRKYETALMKAQTAKALLETEVYKKAAPLELAKLTQEAKGSEKQVQLLTEQIMYEKAHIIGTYNEIAETNATNIFTREQAKVNIDKTKKDIKEITQNGVLNRNLTEAKVEQARVGVRTAKFDAILKKYQAYATKVNTAETKATGASNRRLISADVQSKNKMASLYDQQRKTYIQKQRADVLNIMKELWQVQIDTIGPEGMAIEAIKGPEFSSRIERAALDVGV
jgi:hypothetical protein